MHHAKPVANTLVSLLLLSWGLMVSDIILPEFQARRAQLVTPALKILEGEHREAWLHVLIEPLQEILLEVAQFSARTTGLTVVELKRSIWFLLTVWRVTGSIKFFPLLKIDAFGNVVMLFFEG
jgi:hypothetical protein